MNGYGLDGELVLDTEHLRVALDTMDMSNLISRVTLDCEHLQPPEAPFRVRVNDVRVNLCHQCRDTLLAKRYPLHRNPPHG